MKQGKRDTNTREERYIIDLKEGDRHIICTTSTHDKTFDIGRLTVYPAGNKTAVETVARLVS
jgi:hypothetical protein